MSSLWANLAFLSFQGLREGVKTTFLFLSGAVAIVINVVDINVVNVVVVVDVNVVIIVVNFFSPRPLYGDFFFPLPMKKQKMVSWSHFQSRSSFIEF